MVARALAKAPAKGFEIPLLFVPGFAVLALVATDDVHHLFWLGNEPMSLPINPAGAWGFWAFIAYAYLTVFVALVIIVRVCLRSRGIVARGLRYLAVLLMLPCATNAVFVVFFFSRTGFDPTPIAYAFSGILIAIVLRRFDILDAVPYAKSAFLESIDSPLVVVDSGGLVVGSNEETKRVSPAIDELEGQPIAEVFPSSRARKRRAMRGTGASAASITRSPAICEAERQGMEGPESTSSATSAP